MTTIPARTYQLSTHRTSLGTCTTCPIWHRMRRMTISPITIQRLSVRDLLWSPCSIRQVLVSLETGLRIRKVCTIQLRHSRSSSDNLCSWCATKRRNRHQSHLRPPNLMLSVCRLCLPTSLKRHHWPEIRQWIRWRWRQGPTLAC